MPIFRVEVVGTWDVEAEDEDEALEKLSRLLPPRDHREVDMGVEQSDVKVTVLEQLEEPED